LLRLIAGLEVPDSGEIFLGGERVSRARTILVPPHRRGIGFAFQTPALWPHLTVLDNVLFGLHSLPKDSARSRAEEALASMGALHLSSRKPSDLSGGEARRVSLARALAPRPRFLLLDEPLTHLDNDAKADLTSRLLEAFRSNKTTVLCVTHDPVEASSLGGNIFRFPEKGPRP
jgi:iron(III) transport system ATP-binding protein